MIAKRVSRRRTKDAFKRLGLYILSEAAKAPAGARDGMWPRTAASMLDLAGSGTRVGQVRISNCDAAEPADAIAAIAAVQAMNMRAKGDKTYHLVVSFPQGERPDDEQLRDIEDELCAAIGLADHQRIAAVHTDTDHLHIHIAINKVHPATRRCIEPYYDHRKLMTACERLEIKHGLQRTPHGERHKGLRGRRADMEAHSGQEAFLRWVRQHALPAIETCLREAKSWQTLHRLLAGYDLRVKPRGAGLVLASGAGRIMLRASHVSRALSMQRLVRRWGRYEPLAGERPPAAMRYERAPKSKRARSARLWAEYCERRQAALIGRAAAAGALKESSGQRRRALRDWRAKRARIVQSAGELTGEGRADLWARFRAEAASADAAFERWKRGERAAIASRHPLPTWFGFLQAKAEAGSAEALAILRDRDIKRQEAVDAFWGTADEAGARGVVFSALRPLARKDGAMLYRLRDGGRVIDRAAGLSVEAATPHALFLALSLLVERSPGAIALSGDAAFQRNMVEMAAAKSMRLTFADPALERCRCELMGQAAPEPAQDRQAGLLSRIGQALTSRVRVRRV